MSTRWFVRDFRATTMRGLGWTGPSLDRILITNTDELQETLSLGARPMASMVTCALREAAEAACPEYFAARMAAKSAQVKAG